MSVIPHHKKMLSTKQVAAYLMVTEATVRLLVKQGKFPGAVRPGRSWLVPLIDLEAYVKEKHG